MQEEIWKDVKGYEGYYMVSNFGRVKRISDSNGNPLVEHRLLNPKPKKNKYKLVSLSVNSDITYEYLHRLVATAFIENPHNKPQIDHIDTNRTNNNVSNLRWVTQCENNNNPISKRKISNTLKEYFKTHPNPLLEEKNRLRGEEHPHFGKHGKDNHRSIPVFQFDKQGNLIKEHENAYEAAKELECRPNVICMCCNPEKYPNRKTAVGYKWSYSPIF